MEFREEVNGAICLFAERERVSERVMAPVDLPVAIVRQLRSDNDTDSAILQSLSDAGHYITSRPEVSYYD